MLRGGHWGDGRKYEAIIKTRVSLRRYDVGLVIPALDYVVGIVMCLGLFLFMVAGRKASRQIDRPRLIQGMVEGAHTHTHTHIYIFLCTDGLRMSERQGQKQ